MGLLFFLLFFIFAALGVELFGRLECSDEIPCTGLGEHAHFANFGMAFLTLFRVATGDNWNGIMKDTLRDECDDAADCVKNCCVSAVIAPIFFVIFVLMAQFVLVNVVVAVLMKHLEESHKQMEDDMDIETELEREIEREQLFEEEQALCKELELAQTKVQKRPLTKVSSLPSNFTYSTPVIEKKFNTSRRQTVQYFNPLLGSNPAPLSIMSYNQTPSSTICESNENDLDEDVMIRKPSKPVNRKNILNKFRTQSFDVKLLETSDSVEMDSQSNIKIGQSNGDTAGSSAGNNNLMISKKPTSGPVAASKRMNFRQSSLDFDNRTSACKPLFDNNINNNSSSLLSNKSSFLAVPKLQTTARSRSGSAKQLFKQAALDEDEQTSESSLLLPGGNSGSLILLQPAAGTSVPQIQLPSGSGTSLGGSARSVNDPPISIISSSSSSSSVAQAKGSDAKIVMQTLAVDDGTDGNVKKSESCELLRVISERRKL